MKQRMIVKFLLLAVLCLTFVSSEEDDIKITPNHLKALFFELPIEVKDGEPEPNFEEIANNLSNEDKVIVRDILKSIQYEEIEETESA